MTQAVKWSRRDPRGVTVVLKTSTYEEHIISDHCESDVPGREIACRYAPEIIESPGYIINDSSSEKQAREKYFDTRYIEETGKVRFIVIVVDADKDPREVVTVVMQRTMTDTIAKEGLIYDSSSPEKHKL